jgi:uncharacterized protein
MFFLNRFKKKLIINSMKKIISIAILLVTLFSAATAQQKNITGIWEGKLNAGVELRIVFHFTKNADGSYTGSLDSPDQGVKGIPCSGILVSGDSVTAEIKSINGNFRGLLTMDSVITGTWNQGPASLPLQVKRVAEASALKRPQTPKPPFSYNSEEVEYNNADKSVHFGASFTYPKTGGPFPTAILITGSGQQDRDETIFEHKPFAIIADYLTKKGYAILRVDDRGVGKTNGNVTTATSMDFAADVEAGLNWLHTRKEADKNKTGLIGHSEGGLIASIVASRNKNIDFVIMLAGPGVKGADLLTEQVVAIMNSSGVAPEASAAYKPMYRTIIEFAVTEKDSAAAYAKAYPAFAEWKKKQTVPVLSALNINNDSITDEKMIGNMVKVLGNPWMKYFLSTDPQPMIQKFNCKVLALNGSKDVQVIPALNLAGIKAALEKSHSKTYEVKQIEGLNHLFQHCKTCSPAEYGLLEESFAPEALDIMGKWLDKNILQGK